MALRDLGKWLLELPKFQEQLDSVVVDSACEELGGRFHRAPGFASIYHNWDYLLFAGSILAQSDEGRCQLSALRLAQACLASPESTDTQRDSAALLLDILANHPAIDLAVRRSLLNPSFKDRLPSGAQIDYFRRTIENSILSENGKKFRVNRFQKRLWEKLDGDGWISVSAPTSAGKSYILARWVTELLRDSAEAIVIYLVPTRALISQVERDLRSLFVGEGLEDVAVSALPILKVDEQIPKSQRRVFVLTQERLHILLTAWPTLQVQAMIVDEAHKVGDRQRGVLLQDVVERLSSSNPNIRVLFASPMTSNPELLLADAREGTPRVPLVSEDATVVQNLIWLSQRAYKPLVWDVELHHAASAIQIGEVHLQSKPTNDSKRLSFLAHAIGGGTTGNIVYVNGAAEAEKIAGQLYDLIGEDVGPGSDRQSLRALIELVQHGIHKSFALVTCLRRGVAFHYGNMPLLIREEIERLFGAGTIKYLVCTSTLIEGVNMACRNIFVRGPTKGRGRPLTPEDFWNLAGRAGRWGKEFQGNIFCVDPDRLDLWGG